MTLSVTPFRHAPGNLECLLVDLPDHLNYLTLSDILYSRHVSLLQGVEVLLLRPPVDVPLPESQIAFSDFRPFVERVPQASIHVLHSNHHRHLISSNLNAAVSDQVTSIQDEFLGSVRENELLSYIKKSTALLPARGNSIYRLPSNKYAKNFLRVGNLQTRKYIVDSFFFWMLPYLRDVGAILTETWSISSIALNASKLLQRYRSAENLRCRVDMLSAYHDGSFDSILATEGAVERVSANGTVDVLVVFSAIMTGNSLRRLQETIKAVATDDSRFQFLTLFKLSEEVTAPYLCDMHAAAPNLDFKPHEMRSAELKDCTVIEIDPGTYFPLHIRESEVKITKKAADHSVDFFNTYKNCNIFSIHRSDYDKRGHFYGHRGIYIDVSQMAQQNQFKKKFFDKLAEIEDVPSLIVVPPHIAGDILGNMAVEYYQSLGSQPVLYEHPDLAPNDEQTPKAEISKLSVDQAILILDDVSVEGKRLGRYSKHLRDLDYDGRIHYLVAVARPESLEEWKGRVRDLRFREGSALSHTVNCVEFVVLPNWNANTCPWCHERQWLKSRLLDNPQMPDFGREVALPRLSLLENAPMMRGLVQDVFWRWPDNSPNELTKNSIFLKPVATEADVVAAVASTVQVLRTWDGERIEAKYPHAVVINTDEYLPKVSLLRSKDYLAETFSDPILRISLLRAATTTELVRWDDSAEQYRRDMIREHVSLSKDDLNAIHLELAVALAANKIPKPQLSHQEWGELNFGEYDEITRFLFGL